MISCIFLSAGLSSRFGSPKALAPFQQETVIEYLMGLLLKTNLDEIIVVLGSHAEEIKPFILKHNNVKVVYNKDYNFGQTSSFKVGLKNISSDASGLLLLPIDYPFVRMETINYLIEQFYKKSAPILIPTYGGRRGHPPLFEAELKNEFLALDHSFGVNSIIHQHEKDVALVEVDDPGVIKSFNTKDEFERIKRELL